MFDSGLNWAKKLLGSQQSFNCSLENGIWLALWKLHLRVLF